MPLIKRPQITQDIMGQDLMFPLNYNPKGDLWCTTSADDNLRQAVFLCIFTCVKERFWHRDFGTSVPKSVFKPADQTLCNQLKLDIEHSLDKYEYRITDVKVECIIATKERNKINITVNFTDLKYRHKQNLIFPFYLQPNEGKL